jgi:deoxyribonuclease-4
MTKLRVGAHVEPDAPLATAEAISADCVQIFLSDPQSWRKPPPRHDADELRKAKIDVYVHAPYLINVVSPRNNVRFGSRKILQETCDAAALVGAAAVIVHAGHAEDDVNEGFRRWNGTLDMLKSDVPVLIENTASGNNAMAKRFDTLARLWDVAGDRAGFCFDTCHAYLAGEDLSDAVERVLKIVGRIDLVHCNDSKYATGGRDTHVNLGRGEIGIDVIADMLRATKASAIVCETPGTTADVSADIRFVRETLG